MRRTWYTHHKENIEAHLQITKHSHPPSLAMIEREPGWNPTIPATLSLASITMVTVSELGRIRLPPAVFTSPIIRLSLSSGTASSLITISTVFFKEPADRQEKRQAT